MKIKNSNSIVLIIGFVFLINCTNRRTASQRSIYYWKSNFNLNQNDKEFLNDLHINRIYTKFFDIKWDNINKRPTLLSVIKVNTMPGDSITIVPVIYITNNIFINIKKEHIDDIVERILNKIQYLCNKYGIYDLPEIQIDCDWTLKSKEKYFYFLRKLQNKKEGNPILSATIRLHQIKYYRTTGVPPVDRGVLMYYNMADPKKFNTQNSILDNNIGLEYLINMEEYSLPLDIVLPAFSWGVLFQSQHCVGLINNITKEQFVNNKNFRKLKDNYYKATENCTIEDTQIFKNDVIRIDASNIKGLNNSAKYLSKNINSNDYIISLFSMNSKLIKEWSEDDIQKIYNCFD